MNRILPWLNKLIPTQTAIKGLSRVDPRMGKFLKTAGALYGVDTAINMLRDQFKEPTIESNIGENSVQKAANSRSKTATEIPRAIGKGALGAAAIAGGAGLLGRGAQAAGALSPDEILPAEEIQQEQRQLPNMQKKQMQLPTPGQAGQEQQAPMPNGPINQGMSRQAQARQVEPQEEREPMPLDALSAYSPELSEFIQSQIENGIVPEEAAWLAKNHRKFRSIVTGIEKETKEDFREFITRLLGGGKKKGMMQQEQERFQKGYGQQQQKGQGDQALLAALDKILKM